MKKLFAVILSIVCLMSQLPTVGLAEGTGGIGSPYTAPQSQTKTFNMNLDWRFLVPVPDQRWDKDAGRYYDKGMTLEMSLRNSKDTSGRFFFDANYDENNVKPIGYYEDGDPNKLVQKTGRGYYDTHGNLIEGAAWSTVSIPHSINGLQAFAHNGIDAGERGSDRCFLLYRKEFTVPQGDKFIFELEGIRQAAYVWVNGEEVGYYEAGIAAMGFDISNYVTPGQTAVIAVAEDGTSSRGATEYISETKPKGTLSSASINAFDWEKWGTRDGAGYQWNTVDFNESQIGLLYDAVLHVTGDVYQTYPLYNNLKTTGNYIYADNFDIKGKTATITVDAEIRNESAADKNLTLEVNIVDPDGNLKWSFESAAKTAPKATDAGVVYATTVKDTAYNTDGSGAVLAEGVTTWETVDVTHITASYDVSDVRFWNIDDPYLYDVYTIIKDGENVLDVQKKTTGFRKISYSIDSGLEINDRYMWLPGYAQRSTDEWAVIGVANDWMNDYDMELLKESNADFIRWMHVAPKPAEVRSSDQYGVAVVCPAGDKEGDITGRGWSQRVEAMRDVMIYFRNSPSVVFWETGNNALNVDHSKEMMSVKKALDPHGMRFIGSRSLQNAEAIKESDYVGTMLHGHGETAKTAMDANKKWGPIVETEYNREEAPRRVWDDYSPPDYDYVNKHTGGSKVDYGDVWDLTQEDLSLTAVRSYAGFYNKRVGGSDGSDIYSAIAMMVWSDSNMHNRNSGSENCRTSGRVDPIRQTKDSFYAVQAAQSDKPAVDILGHWSYPEMSADTYNYYAKNLSEKTGDLPKAPDSYYEYDTSKKLKRDPTKKTVYVIGSADVSKVELYRVNGQEEEVIGTCDTPDNTFIYAFPDVDVTKGDAVKAIAYDGRNNVIAQDEITRTTAAYSLRLTPVTSDEGWKADGSDMAFFDVEVLDKNGNVCALNYDKIKFTYSGEGTYLGGYNGGMGGDCFQNSALSQGLSNYFGGSKDEVSTLHQDYVYAECGTNRIFVRATRNAGTFTLNATLCDASGNETNIKASESVTSQEVAVTGGLTTEMPSRQSYTYAEHAPVIESAPAMVSLSDTFEVDWTQVKRVEKQDDTVYYTVMLNGEEFTLPSSAIEYTMGTVFAPIPPVLDKLKELGANVSYTLDDVEENADPKLIIDINGGMDNGGTTLWTKPSENMLYVNNPDGTGDGKDQCADMPFVKDGQFFFEIDLVLKYIDGVRRNIDSDNHVYEITYAAAPSIQVTGTDSATITVVNQPTDTVIYAAKYNSGVLTNVKVVSSGDAVPFMPDKVFLWTTGMQPVAKWEKQ